jgi:hypothetical protein
MTRNPPFVKLVCPPHVVPLLGKVSDRSIARNEGCHPETVQVWRRERGIDSWHQAKRVHPLTCVFCLKTFFVVGGPAPWRKTCPPPKKCQYKQAHKTRRLRKSKTNMRQLRGLMERHILKDLT